MTPLRLGLGAGLALLAGCAGGSGLPPGPEAAGENLALYDAFAEKTLAHGLEASFRLAVDPAHPLDRPAIGLVPLSLLEPREIAALRERLPGEAERRALDALEDRVFDLSAGLDPMVAGRLEKLRAAREKLGLGDGIAVDRALAEAAEPAVRERVWREWAALAGSIGPLVRDLARSRNAWARRVRRMPFLEAAWNRRGFEPGTAARLRAELEGALAPAPDAVPGDPWNVEASDPALLGRLEAGLDEARCLERARWVLTWAGLPADPPALRVVTEYGGGGFATSASFPVDPPRDVRLLVRPGPGLFPHWTTVHEIGHAAVALLAPQGGLALLRRPTSPAVAEGCGKVAERVVYAPEWLRAQGVAEADIEALGSWERQSERARARAILADTAFEEVLYADPEGDLDGAWLRIQREVAGLAPPGELPAWPLEKNLAFKPLARFDYVLARCAQAAIYRRLRALPGGLLGPEAGRVARTAVFGAASGARFEEWFRGAAGEEASCVAWIEDVAGLAVHARWRSRPPAAP